MNRDFSSLVKQILQTNDCYVHLLEELLVQSGCNARIELHITGRGNTIVIREQLNELQN